MGWFLMCKHSLSFTTMSAFTFINTSRCFDLLMYESYSLKVACVKHLKCTLTTVAGVIVGNTNMVK